MKDHPTIIHGVPTTPHAPENTTMNELESREGTTAPSYDFWGHPNTYAMAFRQVARSTGVVMSGALWGAAGAIN